MDNVIKLVEYAPVAVDAEGMREWADAWLGNLLGGACGRPKSVVIIVENEAGSLGLVSQSTGSMDTARLVGLLQMAAWQRADGGCQPDEM